MLTLWFNKQLAKQKERQMDKKRSFYKWLVLTQSKHYLKVVDIMVKNSKVTQSKAAYILWQRMRQENQEIELTPRQKNIF